MVVMDHRGAEVQQATGTARWRTVLTAADKSLKLERASHTATAVGNVIYVVAGRTG